MQSRRMGFIAGAAMAIASAAAGAQLRRPVAVPAGFMPPAGMCRVWINGVAPGRQAPPTTCPAARANLRTDSRLIYGPLPRTTPQGGTYDPRTDGYDPRNGGYDPRDDRGRGGYENARDDDGRYDRLSDRQRRELEKERRKREKERSKEWRQSHRQGHDDGDDDDDNDDDDDDDRNDRNDRRNGRDERNDDRRTGRDERTGATRGVYGGQGTGATRGVYGGQDTGARTSPRTGGRVGLPCVDANHDGVCDTQPGMGRRIP